MKKLSLLIALFMCLTIGGVYATWSYAGTNDIADAYAEAKVTITDAELTGANGTYKIESNLVLYIDDADNDHHAELVFDSNNDQPIFLTVTFTPAANAGADIKKEAVESELYFTLTTPMQYNMDEDGNYSETGTPTDIFWFSNPGNDTLDNKFTWTKNGQDPVTGYCTSFTYTLNETQLKDMIKLSQDFFLDTKAEHDAFRTALKGNIVARVTDGTVNN